MATSTNKSAARKAGILDNPYLAQSAIAEGHIVAHGAAEGEAILPATSAGDMKLAGVNIAGGQAGATMVAGTDMFAAQWHGRAKVKLKAGQTANRGDHAVPADTTGAIKSRTLYSFSQNVVGTLPQTKTAGAADDFIECDLAPRLVEIVRPVVGGATTALGAATKYATAPGQAGAAAQIPLYIARFTGETVRNLSVNIATAPGGADTVIFTIQKSSDNGGTWTDTTITCTPVAGTGKAASDLTHSVSLTAGDMLAVKMVSSNTTAAAITVAFDVT